jgi:DNA-binding CsgD family transcriptional regulator
VKKNQFGQSDFYAMWDAALAAVADSTQWSALLEVIANSFNARNAVVVTHNYKAGSITAYARRDAEAVARYNAYFHAMDPWGTHPRAPLAVRSGQVLLGSDLITRTELARTEYFEFGQKHEMTKPIGIPIGMNYGNPFGICIYRGERDSDFGSIEANALAQIAPALRQTFQAGSLFSQLITERDASTAALSTIQTAVFVVDDRGSVSVANGAGEALLEHADGLRLRDGHLTALTVDITKLLHSLCSEMGRCDSSIRSIVLPQRHGAPLRVAVAPVKVAKNWTVGKRPCAVVLVTSDDEVPMPDQRILRELFGLTVTEAAILSRLAAGESLRQIATGRHYTLGTARWYSKQLLAKTGCRNRADMVRKVVRSSADIFSKRK